MYGFYDEYEDDYAGTYAHDVEGTAMCQCPTSAPAILMKRMTKIKTIMSNPEL